MSKLEVPEIPLEVAYEQLLVLFRTYVEAFMRALTDKFGSEEALKLLRPYLLEVGKETAEVSAPLLGITGKDAIAIGTILHTFEKEILKIEGKVTEASPDKLVAVNTKCIFSDCKPETCLQFEHTITGAIEAINPEYTIRTTKLMPRGDKVCEWIIEKKTE